MRTITAREHTFQAIIIKDSSQRRAILFQNNIIESLKKIGIAEDDIDIRMERLAIKRVPASVSFYVNGFHLHYSYHKEQKFVENLYVISKVIELEVNDILAGKKTIEEFIDDFEEDHNIDKKRKEARKTLGVEPDCKDLELINKRYKQLAKEHHPDMEGGDSEQFKKINNAHKILKRELE